MIIVDNETALSYLLKYKAEHNLKNYQLAEVFNVSSQMISAIKTKKRPVSKKIIKQLAAEYPDLDIGGLHSDYIYHYSRRARSLDDYQTKYRIPTVHEPAYSFECRRSIKGLCGEGDLLITEVEESDHFMKNDLVVRFTQRHQVHKGDEGKKGFLVFAIVKYK